MIPKFRVWNGKRMIYVADKRNDTCITFFEWGWEVQDHFSGKFESLVRSWDNKDAVLMKYTGLKDKNDKEIYEGDIFTFDFVKELNNSIPLIGSFDWHNDELRYEIDVHNQEEYLCLSYCGNPVMQNFEVIGNMYEHPSLLKR